MAGPKPPEAHEAVKAPPTEYVAGGDLVYVRTASSGAHGIQVDPGGDVPADALPAHLETLVNLGLVVTRAEAEAKGQS